MHTKRFVLLTSILAISVILPAAVFAATLIGEKHKDEHWHMIPRNTIGSPLIILADGPYGSFEAYGTPQAEPPFGKGSLQLAVANNSTTLSPPSEKAAFGNEVDFVGDPVLALSAVGFYVYQTGENIAYGGASNMPNIQFEIDPNLTAGGDDYTTMIWLPGPWAGLPNRWSGYLDATTTGTWYFTGGEGTATGCSQATPCSFAAAMAALNDGGASAEPIFYTVMINKGRDSMWIGAVDGLRINDKLYDFEAGGVKRKGAK